MYLHRLVILPNSSNFSLMNFSTCSFSHELGNPLTYKLVLQLVVPLLAFGKNFWTEIACPPNSVPSKSPIAVTASSLFSNWQYPYPNHGHPKRLTKMFVIFVISNSTAENRSEFSELVFNNFSSNRFVQIFNVEVGIRIELIEVFFETNPDLSSKEGAVVELVLGLLGGLRVVEVGETESSWFTGVKILLNRDAHKLDRVRLGQ